MGVTPPFLVCVCVNGCNATFSRLCVCVNGCNATFSCVCVCLWVQRHFSRLCVLMDVTPLVYARVCVFMGATPLFHVCVCVYGCNATFSLLCV